MVCEACYEELGVCLVLPNYLEFGLRMNLFHLFIVLFMCLKRDGRCCRGKIFPDTKLVKYFGNAIDIFEKKLTLVIRYNTVSYPPTLKNPRFGDVNLSEKQLREHQKNAVTK